MNRTPSQKIVAKIDQLYNSSHDITLIALCTTDGFSIYQASENFKTVPDKIAAATSTLSSVSDSIAKEIMSTSLNVSCIESDSGNCVSVHSACGDQKTVLTVSAGVGMSLGELRVRAKRLADQISEINVKQI